MLKWNTLPAVWLCGLLLWCGSCTRPASESQRHIPAKRVVAVSLPPHASLLDRLTGDSVQVVCLLRADDDPEHYEPSAAALAHVQHAALYFMAGNLSFESELISRLREVRPDLDVVNVSDGVPLLYGSHHHGGHHHDLADPHTWTSVRNMRIAAHNMAAALQRTWPHDSAFLAAREATIVAWLDSLDNALSRRLAQHRGEAFAVYHPALTYFARDYGLQQVAVQQREQDPNVAELREAIHNARNADVRVFFVPSRSAGNLCATLADDIGARIVTIKPMAYNWNDELQKITDAFNKP